MKSVFLIGDSIRLGYERYVKAMLEGNADVYTPGDVNGGMAQFVQRWVHMWKTQQNVPDDLELVHWNAGLWDVLRIFGDDTFTSPQFYKETLVKIHNRLRMLFPKAKIVFALSTAVREKDYRGEYQRWNRDIEAFNQIAIETLQPLGETFNDLVKAAEVIDSFEFDENVTEEMAPQVLYNKLAEINGAEIPTIDSIRAIAFRGAMQEGDIVVFDMDFYHEEEKSDEEPAGKCAEEKRDPVAECPYVEAAQNQNTGKVMVEINGGLRTALVDINPGITTLEQVVHTDIVRAKSGETDERLSAYVVIYKGQARQCDELRYIHPEHGDLIQITPPTLSTKGKRLIERAKAFCKHILHKAWKKG